MGELRKTSPSTVAGLLAHILITRHQKTKQKCCPLGRNIQQNRDVKIVGVSSPWELNLVRWGLTIAGSEHRTGFMSPLLAHTHSVNRLKKLINKEIIK
jgi:hypothetical protein